MHKIIQRPSISSALCLLFMFNSGSALAAEPVSFSASAGTPTNTHDNNLVTRWGAQGVGEWIEYDLGRPFNVEALDIAFHRGDERSATIEIETSIDGNNYTVVFSGDSASNTLAQQPFDVQDTEAQYVRIVGFGNTINDWISLTEVDIVSSEISTDVAEISPDVPEVSPDVPEVSPDVPEASPDVPNTPSDSYNVVRLNNGQPIIDRDMFTNLGVDSEGDNINGPSLIRIPNWIPASERADPSAVYYLYFAHHDGEYIRLAWASNITGPWRLHDTGSNVRVGDRGVLDNSGRAIDVGRGLVIEANHLASPDVHVDNENQRIIMYFHSGSSTTFNGTEVGGQVSWVSTSSDGLDFNGNIEPAFFSASYLRVFEHGGELYGLDNSGVPRRALDPNDPWTAPANYYSEANVGRLWESHPNDFIGDAIEDETGYSRSELRVRHTAVHLVGDELQVFYSQRGEDAPERIMLSTIDLGVNNWEDWEFSYPPVTLLQAASGWEGGQFTPRPSEAGEASGDVNQLRDPYVFEDNDGSLYLIYTGNGESGLGIASLTGGPTDGGGNDDLVNVDPVNVDPVDDDPVNDDPVNDIPADGSVNLAQGRSVSQSSTDFGGQASRAVDGNTDGVWARGSVTHTATEAQPWWQVDLGSVSRISHINLHNRIDCCADRLSDFHVLVSETPFTTNDLISNLANNAVNSFYNGSTAGSPTRIEVNANGRYVRVQLAGSNPLSLAEVEVFGGDPVNADPVNDEPVNDDSIIVDEAYADIPDFSHVGYLTTGERDLPNYEMPRRTVSAVNGDDWANIRDAINEVASFTPDANGYRGVVYLPDAAYEVSQSIRISTSGIIVEGGGRDFTTVTATWVQSTGAEQGVFHVEGTGSPVGVGAERRILETREPGDNSLNVGSGHGFNVGDTVWVITRPTEDWTNLLGVTEIWGGSELPEMERRYKRTVIGASASTIEIDAPLVDAIDNVLVPGSVQRYSWNGVVRQVGIRNLHVSSVFASATDENHAWTGVYFENAQDGFVDSVDGTHFVYATVYTDEDAYRITVIDSSYSLPRGQIRGSRRYAFTTRGQLMLFRRVFAQEARHSFTTNTGSAGPNAFVECVAEDDTHESGPYHRWNPGTLLDDCSSEHEIATQDRLAHTAPLRGWTGASVVFFNCEAPSVIMGTPSGLQNWAYGCVENSGDGVISTGGSPGTTTIDSTGNRVQTAAGFDSLYDQQSHERGILSLTKSGLTSPNGEPVTSAGAGAGTGTGTFDRLLTLLLISITILRWRRRTRLT